MKCCYCNKNNAKIVKQTVYKGDRPASIALSTLICFPYGICRIMSNGKISINKNIKICPDCGKEQEL